MTRSIEETRREFLLKLARAAAFVPPLLASVAVGEAAAQGSGSSSTGDDGKGKGSAVGQTGSTVGGLSPTSQQMENPTFSLQRQESSAPWQGQASQPPPWSAPPPTQTGR